MGRHTITMFFALLVMLLALTGCEKKYTGGETEKASDTEIQTEIESEKETNPETVRESVESDKVTESSNQNKKVFESSLGYSVIYDDTAFEYNRTGDYDEIGLKGQTFSSKPVFFAAMKIKNEDIATVMDQIFNHSSYKPETVPLYYLLPLLQLPPVFLSTHSEVSVILLRNPQFVPP